MEAAIDELRELIEGYLVAIQLERHYEVSEKGIKIQRKLIELLDDELSQASDNLDQNDLLLLEKLNSICQKLRAQAKLAATYGDVLHFVQDMACLSALVGATPERESKSFDCDSLSCVLRKSTYLLRYINSACDIGGGEELYLNRASITRILGIGFPIFHVADLFKTNLGNHKDSHSLGSLLAMRGERQITPLSQVAQSEWFEEFLNKTLGEPYPMDRFTILTSVWMIAAECKHVLLEQVVGELAGQIYHE